MLFRPHLLLLSGCALLLSALSPGIAAERPAPPPFPGLTAPLLRVPYLPAPAVDDRTFWGAPADGAAFAEVLPLADQVLQEEFPPLTDDGYLDYSRTGNRSRYQRLVERRQTAANILAGAYLLTRDRKYLARLEPLLNDFCALKSWVLPAHDPELDTFSGRDQILDLGSTRLSWRLATLYRLLLPDLTPETAARLKAELYRRTIVPMEQAFRGERPEYWWMRQENNWNSVCLAAVAGTVLALEEDPARARALIDRIVAYSHYGLKAFPADGYCSEGVSYWNYGFGAYLDLALLVHQATGGKERLLDRPDARPPLSYPAKIRMADGLYPSFADCPFGAQIQPDHLLVIDFLEGRRDRLPGRPFTTPAALLRSFAGNQSAAGTAPAAPPAADADAPESSFEQAGIAVLRPGAFPDCRLHAAIKGGSNHELHNHNDVGSYVIAVDRVPILVDPGSEIYTARTFGNQRYRSNVLNSFGHPVPVVAGARQRHGEATDAVLLAQSVTPERFRWQLDLTPAYRAEGLRRLQRSFEFDRTGAGTFTVDDRMTADRPLRFENALITFGTFTVIAGDTVRVEDRGKALLAVIDAHGAPFNFAEEEIREELPGKRRPRRLAIRFREPVSDARLTLRIAPAAP